MRTFYKAWKVYEIEDPADWLLKKNVVRGSHAICYVDGLDAKVVTVFTKDEDDFFGTKAEEILWDIFGEPCLYLTNGDFQDFIDSWEKFLDLQQEFWFQIAKDSHHKNNISLMRKSLITIGSYKLLQIKKPSKKEHWDENKLNLLLELFGDIYTDLRNIKITVWGSNELVLTKLQAFGIQVNAVNLDDPNNTRSQLVESAVGADGLIILYDCAKVREISLLPVLEKMNQKFIFDSCYIFETSEIEKLGARLLYC